MKLFSRFLGVTCLGLFLLPYFAIAGDERERAVKAIKRAGGYLRPILGTQPKKYNTLFFLPDADVDVDAVLKEIHHFPELQAVDLSKLATDDHLKAIAVLPRLNDLNLRGSKVTDEGMKAVAVHQGVMDLQIDDTNVGDAGLKEITKIKGLRRLYMANTQVTDKGLKELVVLKNLSDLVVGPRITDEGVTEIGKIGTITTLSLPGAEITGKGLKNLSPLKSLLILGVKSGKLLDGDLMALDAFANLAMVSLSCPQITDKGLVHLANRNLGRVLLRGTQVTDAGILQLAAMQGLSQLDVRDTKVTEEGRNAFRKLRPRVQFLTQ